MLENQLSLSTNRYKKPITICPELEVAHEGDFKPGLYHCYKTEELMCNRFWAQVQDLITWKQIPEHSIYHNSNNQRRSGKGGVIAGAKDKAMGVVPGVFDYTVTGIGYLEAKHWYVNAKGKIIRNYLSDEQKAFAAHVKSMGMRVGEFLLPEHGINLLQQWLKEARGNVSIR